MKKKLIVFLTVIFGGLFILLYNPLKELALSSGEVKASETNAAAAEEYSELEKFLMNEKSGAFAVGRDYTITHELNLSFQTITEKTINIAINPETGPVKCKLILEADIIIGDNCVLEGLTLLEIIPLKGHIIMKGNGTVKFKLQAGSLSSDCIKYDSTYTGNISFSEGGVMLAQFY